MARCTCSSMSNAGDLALAAAAYALNAGCHLNPHSQQGTDDAPEFWPWIQRDNDPDGRSIFAAWWKPTVPRRDLVKAGALILAEIERLDRAATSADAALAASKGEIGQ